MGASALYKLITCVNEDEYKNGAYVSADKIRPFVQVYSSRNVGAGKSFLIKKWAEKQNATLIRVPVNSTDIHANFIIDRLRTDLKAERRVIHIDISSCAGADVNLLLFKIVMLRHVSTQG